MDSEKRGRMRELTGILHAASDAYYNGDREIISDREYDGLYDELARLESETGVVFSNSPTRKVGYEVRDGLARVTHGIPLLSLDKTKEVEKLISFLGDRPGVLSWKLDGLTIVLRYADGALAQAVTRGNGLVGEDVTHNAKAFANVPVVISYKGNLSVRGEAVIGFRDFEAINGSEEGGGKYKNPRNLCSGSVRQLNSEVTGSRNVRFFAYKLLSADGPVSDSKTAQMGWLESMGFETVEYETVGGEGLAGAVKSFGDKAAGLEYATDGLVLTFDSVSYGDSLGATSKFPKDSLAFKWTDETAETTLIEIQWSASRTGLINPIAVFEPVEIEGTTINRASLHNVSIVKGLELGVGDRITVYKANMIIPQVAENLTRGGGAEIPDKCPVCGGATEMDLQNEVESLYCANPMCKAQLTRSLAHFVSRDAMNIEGLSLQTLEKFTENGLVGNYADIYGLPAHGDMISNMAGFGAKSFENLVNSIERSREVAPHNLIYALGIRHVGLSSAKLLCGFYNGDIYEIMRAKPEELNAIEGFGPVLSQSACNYFSDANNAALLERLMKSLRIKKPVPRGTRPLENLNFVITGEVSRFAGRNELKERIESLGGRVSGGVSSKTDYLINNDILSKSSKNKTARELNVPVITEDEFMDKFLGEGTDA